MRLSRLPAQTRRLFCAVVGLCGLLATGQGKAQEAQTRPIRFPLHPSLSADGKTLAFAWQGDIWTVPAEGGRAQRFTIHEAYDTHPRWSPDGKWLAFTSDRAGNDDVWIMPATGGKPRQLTFHSALDRVSNWTPDSKEILFTSSRETTRTTCIYAVNIETGRTRRIAEDHDPLGGAATTPDGTQVACVCSGTTARKVYRGSANAKLMLFPIQGGPGKWLVKETDNARWAMFALDGKAFTYVSDRDGTANLWRRSFPGDKLTQLTHFKEGNILYPTLSKDGSKVVFMHDFGIWSASTRGGEPKEIRIFAPTDERTNPIRRETYTTGAQEIALSPNGRNLAFVVHGEIFVEPATGAPAVDPEPEDDSATPKRPANEAPTFRNVMRLTDTPQREKEITWSPDGKQIAFTSDRDGNNNLYIMDVRTKATRQLTKSVTTEQNPVFSPDGKQIAFLRGYNGAELCLIPTGGGEVRVLMHDPDISGVAWSPDAQWLAFSRLKAHSGGQASDIFVLNVATGKATNITRYPALNFNPAWAPDGQTLFFLSNRTTNNNLWSVPLLLEKPKAGAEEATKPAEPAKPGEAAKPGEKKPVTVKIDFEDIHERAKQLTTLEGVGGYVVSPDGKTLIFLARVMGRFDLWRLSVAGGVPARLTQTGEAAGGAEFAPDGSRIVYVAGGAIRSLALNAPAAEPTSIPFSARMDVDTRVEMLALFDEAWRTLRDGFYDAKMHGVDWNHVRDLYRPVVEDLTYKEDFYMLFELAMGELNCSHVGIGNPGARSGSPATPSLGVAYDNAYTGPGVRVAFVMPKGPADKERSRLKVGDILLKVDDQPIVGNETFYRLLDDRANKNVDLLVSSDGKEAGARTVHIRPILSSAYRQLEYDRLIKEREQLTAKLSNGKIGYVHLSAMDQPNLEKFKRLVFGDYSDKEGVIVDVRDNGGGSTAPQLLEVLQNRISGYRTIRDDPKRTTSPLLAWTKPTLMLTNENSYSNAEVLPWGFKELGLGKVAGVATHGAVIGTGGTTLLDGTMLRLPSIGAYTLSGKNMENNGCPPDILVENTPDDIFQNHDRQLERGVEELLKQLPSPAPNR